MGKRAEPVVNLRDGTSGAVEAWQPDSGDGARALVRFEDDVRVWVPVESLVPLDGGGYALPLDRAQLAAGPTVIPVVAEELAVRRREVTTATVRLRKVVHEREEVIAPMITRQLVDVQRVPVGRIVDGPVPTRQEGDTLIVPVLEEVVVEQRRLLLVEELRVTVRREQAESAPQRVTLRREEVVVERVTADPKKPSGPT